MYIVAITSCVPHCVVIVSRIVSFECKTHYINCLIKELGINSATGNPTYTRTDLTKDEILSNHKGALQSFGIHLKNDELNLSSLYWIPKLHKNPYKERYIAGSSKCATKPLSVQLTKILYNYQRSSSVLLGQSILYLWHKSNVDSKKFNRATRTFQFTVFGTHKQYQNL